MLNSFCYDDLFRLLPQSFKVSQRDLVPGGATPVYSSNGSNNGRVGFTNREALFKISDSIPVYLVFGDHTKTMNIVNHDFCVMDNVKVLAPLIAVADEALLYITTCWKKAIPNLGYARHWSVAKKARFDLPVIKSDDPNHTYTAEDIDYGYMHEYIAELERERVAELERERVAELDTYLAASGLDDYELTHEDRQLLAAHRGLVSARVEDVDKARESKQTVFSTFRVDEVFRKVEARCRRRGFDKRRDTSTMPDEEYCIPLVNAKLGDNGIMFYGRRSDWDTQEMCLDVIQNGASATGTVYAQPGPVGVLWDAYLIKPVDQPVSTQALLYLSKCVEKITKEQFSYDKKATWDRVRHCEITLPVTPAGNIDFDYMERYIRAVEKVVIADVVRYKEAVIETATSLIDAA